MITTIVQGKNNIKKQRIKCTQTQFLNTVHSFVYFPTYSVQICVCVDLNRWWLTNTIRLLSRGGGASPLTGTWLFME